MKKLNIKPIATMASLLVILVFVSIMAYFTSTDAVTNRLVAGNLKVTINEGSYVNGQTIGYAQKVTKQPKVINDSKTDAIVFLEVKIPKRTGLKIVDNNGELVTKNDSEALELFTTYYNETQGYNESDWIYLDNKSTVKNTENGYNTYVYGYKKVVKANDDTEVLFDAVRLINLLEIDENDNQMKNLLEKFQDIDITAYGIQAKYLPNEDGSEFAVNDINNIQSSELETAWGILKGE